MRSVLQSGEPAHRLTSVHAPLMAYTANARTTTLFSSQTSYHPSLGRRLGARTLRSHVHSLTSLSLSSLFSLDRFADISSGFVPAQEQPRCCSRPLPQGGDVRPGQRQTQREVDILYCRYMMCTVSHLARNQCHVPSHPPPSVRVFVRLLAVMHGHGRIGLHERLWHRFVNSQDHRDRMGRQEQSPVQALPEEAPSLCVSVQARPHEEWAKVEP